MLRSTAVVFTAIFAVLFLRRKLFRQHWTGVLSIVFGVFLVGLSYSGGSSTAAGIIILLIGQVFGATGYIMEEKYLGDFEEFDPYMMAGMEGVWATLMWLIILPIM